ncbi:hypothetical protein XENOCAPTIV_020660 [Xenoophorus captivus]|uniref:Uncharacterized protein n=1 Tax=Xenoophorus captivus TaxID=1517983 RepID=A0ABV0QAW8_9TELE
MCVDDFSKSPSVEFLEQCTREQLVKIAEHCKICVGDNRLKENVKAILRENLIKMGVVILSPKPDDLVSQVAHPDLLLDYEQQKKMLKLRIQLEKEKELALANLRYQANLDKTLAVENN